MRAKTLRIRFNIIEKFCKIHNQDIYCYLIKVIVIRFVLKVKKMVSWIVLIIILQKSELIHMILYLLKKILTVRNVIILIKSVVNKDKNNYYYNIFLEEGLYKDKSNTKYFLNECLYIINAIFRYNNRCY